MVVCCAVACGAVLVVVCDAEALLWFVMLGFVMACGIAKGH